MSTLLNNLRENVTGQRKEKMRRYRELLENSASAGRAEVEEIQSLMKDLGKSLTDVTNDQAIINNIARLESIAANLDEKAKAATAAHRSNKAFFEEMESRIAEMKDQHRLVLCEMDKANSEHRRAKDATFALGEIRNDPKNKDLLGLV